MIGRGTGNRADFDGCTISIGCNERIPWENSDNQNCFPKNVPQLLESNGLCGRSRGVRHLKARNSRCEWSSYLRLQGSQSTGASVCLLEGFTRTTSSGGSSNPFFTRPKMRLRRAAGHKAAGSGSSQESRGLTALGSPRIAHSWPREVQGCVTQDNLRAGARADRGILSLECRCLQESERREAFGSIRH